MATDRDLKLRLVMALADKVTKPLKKISEGSSKTAEALRASKEELDRLKRGQRDITSFRKLQGATRNSSEALADAQEKLRGMREELRRTQAPSQKFQDDFVKAKGKVEKLTGKLEAQRRELGDVRSRMHDVGIETRELGTAEIRLGDQIKRANEQLDVQKRKLGQVADQQRRLADARGTFDNRMGRAGAMQGAGTSAMFGGVAAALPLVASARTSIEFEAQMRDMAITGNLTDQQEEALSRSVRQSAKEWNATMAEIDQGLGVLVANGIKDVKALSAYGNMIAKTSTATGAATQDIGALIYSLQGNLHVAVKDTMATLDGLAYSGKQGSFELKDMARWVPQLGPQMASLGAQGREAAAELGAALQIARLGAGSNDQAANNLTNYLSKITATETVKQFNDAGIDLQQRLLEMRTQGITPLVGSLKIIQEYMGTKGPKALEQFKAAMAIDDGGKRAAAMEKLSSAFALGDLFADQQVLAFIRPAIANMEKFKEIYEGSMQASGVIDDDWNRRMEIGKQQLKDFKISMQDLGLTIGNALMPALTDIVNAAARVADTLGEWAERNPELSRTLVVAAATLSALVVAGGAFLLVAGSLLGPIAMIGWGMEVLGIKAGGAESKLGKLAKNGIKAIGNSLLWLGRTFAAVGRLFLLNPIGIAVTLIAGAAYLIYKNWSDISQFFTDRWQDIKAAFNQGIGATLKLLLNWNPVALIYRVATAGLEAMGINIAEDFKSLGGAIIDGIIGGIDMRWQELKDKITGLGGWMEGWFKDDQKIRSPSRVWAELGNHTMQGLANGIEDGANEPLRNVVSLSKRLKRAGAGLAIGAASLPALADIPLDTRPPISAAGSGVTMHNEISINVTPIPGMDEQALARYVAAEVQRALASAEREAGARRRSALYDTD